MDKKFECQSFDPANVPPKLVQSIHKKIGVTLIVSFDCSVDETSANINCELAPVKNCIESNIYEFISYVEDTLNMQSPKKS